MKKHFKMMAVLSAAGILTAAAPQLGLNGAIGTVFAKDLGWVQEDQTWRYYEDEDYYVTDTWKKRDNNWYYLDEDGRTAVNAQIDEYYVDAEGKRVSNQWVSIENEEDWDSREMPERYWYYYGKNGQMVTAKWLKIENKWHYFDEDGRMLTGKVEIEGDTYYLGGHDDGAMTYGWVQLENESDDPESTHSWHYFEKDGKMVKNQIDKKINGDYYTFEDGVMKTGWYKLPAPAAETENATASDASKLSDDSVAGYQYYDPDSGKRVNGWRTIEGAPGISEEGEFYTFYFKNGAPLCAQTGIQVFTVDSKRYGFNTKGERQKGLKVVTLEDGSTANFYFGDDGVMRTGKQVIYDEDLDENQTWFFYTDGSRKGQGFHGIRDNSVYEYGLRKDAEADLRFAPVDLEGKQYLVNTSGAIQKASASSKSSVKPELDKGYKDVKDSNGKIWVVDVNGIIQ